MPVPAPPTISVLPPAPILGTDTNEDFSTKVDDIFSPGGLPNFITEANAFGEFLHDDFTPALIDLAAAANYSATSSSSLTIGTGTKALTIEEGKMFLPGQPVAIADAAAPTTNRMYGEVLSYDLLTGALSVDVLRVKGSGTIADWYVALSGEQGQGGDVLPAFSGNAGKVLSVNSGETDFLWIDQGWELIGTLSPSNSEAIFSSIPTIYSDLKITIENATWSSFPALSVSPNGSSWAPDMTSWGPSAPGSGCYGAVEITGIRHNAGLWRAYAATGASPSMGSTIQSSRWRVTGGITAVRISGNSGANFTGTCYLFGRL